MGLIENNRLFPYFYFKVYGSDELIDMRLSTLLKIGLKSFHGDAHWIGLEFNDGTKGRIWNANWPYAWASEGQLGNYSWSSRTPSKYMMRKLRKAMFDLARS